MAVTFAELRSGLRTENDSRERMFLGSGSSDEDEIQSEAESQLASIDGGFGNRQIRVEPINIETGLWEVTASYSKSAAVSPPEVGQSSYEFEISTTSTHITQSKATTDGQGEPGAPTIPDFSGAIGVTPDGVEGCDILTPESRFSETHYLSDATVTAAYRRMLRSMVGKVNDAAFRDHDGGEVLLVGVRGGKRASDDVWELTFNFATSDNDGSIVVGGLAPFNKGGWEYLWVYYEPSTDADRIVPVPAFGYVERVYDAGDFSTLGIGT